MLGLLLLGELWVELVPADGIKSFPNGGISLDIAVHPLNVRQLHILFLVVV